VERKINKIVKKSEKSEKSEKKMNNKKMFRVLQFTFLIK